MSKRLALALLIVAAVFQTAFSFLSPVYESNNSCQHSADYFLDTNSARMKEFFHVNEGEISVTQKVFQLIPNYRVVCDSMSFIYHAKVGFPYGFIERNIYIDQPLYEFFAFLFLKPISLFVVPSYPLIFSIFILLNFLMLIVTIYLFYDLLAKLISPKISFWSSLLLVFSPFVHAMVSQPTSSGVMEIFVVSACLWLLIDYIKNPTRKKIILYSLSFGILLMGKQIVALSIFVLFLSFLFKRKREGLLFLGLQIVPVVLWYLFVRLILDIPFVSTNIQLGQGSWFLRPEYWHFFKLANIILTTVPNFLSSLIYGFILIPVIFAIYGLYKLDLQGKYILSLSFLGSFQVLFFIMNYYRPSLSFLLFPVIYPTAILGIIHVSKYFKRFGGIFSSVFFYSTIAVIIILSNLNLYNFGIWH